MRSPVFRSVMLAALVVGAFGRPTARFVALMDGTSATDTAEKCDVLKKDIYLLWGQIDQLKIDDQMGSSDYKRLLKEIDAKESAIKRLAGPGFDLPGFLGSEHPKIKEHAELMKSRIHSKIDELNAAKANGKDATPEFKDGIALITTCKLTIKRIAPPGFDVDSFIGRRRSWQAIMGQSTSTSSSTSESSSSESESSSSSSGSSASSADSVAPASDSPLQVGGSDKEGGEGPGKDGNGGQGPSNGGQPEDGQPDDGQSGGGQPGGGQSGGCQPGGGGGGGKPGGGGGQPSGGGGGGKPSGGSSGGGGGGNGGTY